MSPLQPTSAGYNPLANATASSYGHPYGASHHSMQAPPPPTMHGMPPGHYQGQQQTNAHMIPVQNGPVILVSNLNEDVSSFHGYCLSVKRKSILQNIDAFSFPIESVEKQISFLKSIFFILTSIYFCLFSTFGRLDDHSRGLIYTIRYVFVLFLFSLFFFSDSNSYQRAIIREKNNTSSYFDASINVFYVLYF